MTTSRKRCAYCRKSKPTEEMVRFGVSHFCNFEEAVKYCNKPSTKEKGRKIQRKIDREKKESVRPLKWYADRAQQVFNKFIRLRDKGLDCVSCGKPDNGTHQIHASHYRSRGSCSALRFDEKNVHASCAQCNNHLSGNIEGFTPELIRRIGKDEFNRITSSPKSRKWSKGELIEIYEIYKAKCKELENK